LTFILARFGHASDRAGFFNGPEVTVMVKRLPKCLFLLGVVIAALLVVATGASVTRPDTTLRGYARLLTQDAVKKAARPGLTTDCVMQQARLRGQGSIPEEQFNAVREFCRQAARLDGQASGKTTTGKCGSDTLLALRTVEPVGSGDRS
jgi:hypothetical protein